LKDMNLRSVRKANERIPNSECIRLNNAVFLVIKIVKRRDRDLYCADCDLNPGPTWKPRLNYLKCAVDHIYQEGIELFQRSFQGSGLCHDDVGLQRRPHNIASVLDRVKDITVVKIWKKYTV
ncbi:hypothetical protein HDU93_009467, partial [Gonapodya sp. JEL0774]